MRPGTHLLCLACGRWFANLAIHLSAAHAMTAGQYRDRFSLPAGSPIRRTPALTGDLDGREQSWRARSAPRGKGPEQAYRYWHRYGHLNVPAGHVTADGFGLGAWISAQRTRRQAGYLPAAEIAALEAIGMTWTRELL